MKNVFSENYYVDTLVISDISADICTVMTKADDIIQEAAGVVREIIALETSVPAKAQCGALTGVCATALSVIRNIDFKSYGQRIKASMAELCDYSDFANQRLVESMQINSERLSGITAGVKSLSMLMKYTRTGSNRDVEKTRVGQGVVNEDDEKDDKNRCISLEYQAAMLAGIKTNGSELPNITNGVDAQRYLECLKKLKRGQYSNMEIAAAVAGIPVNNGIVSINNGSEAKRYIDVLNKLPNKPNEKFYYYTRDKINEITTINHEMDAELQKFINAYQKNKVRYIKLAEECNVPPEVIAVIHYRENTADYLNGTFKVYLHNGEPLGKETQKYPKDLLFYDFNTAAKDALDRTRNNADKYYLTKESMDLVGMMCYLEDYNGAGYYKNNHISPYSYSGTNVYISGKYVEEDMGDGSKKSVYHEETIDAQIGSYLLLNAIFEKEGI